MKKATRRGSGKAPRVQVDGDTHRLTASLTHWFEFKARRLPWRTKRRNAYAALVSEAMLQQTQVSRVVDIYQRFMGRFPDVQSLADADEQDVLGMWQGLGYYRRARNLHAAARMITVQFEGRVPSSIDELRQLPGVGRYTAGAIASIVFNRREPLVDGNVQRVLSRLFAHESRRREKDLVAWTWTKAAELVEAAACPGAFNEGLMELGATICTPAPSTPKCRVCPLRDFCGATHMGVQDSIPAPRKRQSRRAVHHHAVILRQPRTRRILMQQRPNAGMWSNMWQVPTVEADVELSRNEIVDKMVPAVGSLRHLHEFSHQTTHRLIKFHVFAGRTAARKGRWVDPTEADLLPISNAQKRVLRCLRSS